MKEYNIKNFKDNAFLSIIRIDKNRNRSIKTKLDIKKKHKCSNCLKKTICYTSISNLSSDSLCLKCISDIIAVNIYVNAM